MLFNTPQFRGSRLREAREARALSQVALADLLSISSSSISQYESGDQIPSPPIMVRICEKLNLPPQFFTAARPERREPSLFWRSRSAATKRAREAHERKYGWFRDIVSLMAGYVEFPAPNLPDLKPPADPVAISDEDIEEYATQVRRHWGLGDGPISNAVWLIENNGGIVVRGELGDETLDAFSDWDSQDSWRCYIFLGSDKRSAVRSRFDVAHELGHAIMHRNVPGRVLRTSPVHKLMEHQANRFAGAFMMPASTFSSEVYAPSLQSLLHLKPRWKMGIAAMVYRLYELGAISDDRRRQLSIQMSRNGWRKREPLDDTMDPEEPRLLKRSLDLLLDNGILRPEELEQRILIGPRDVEKLVGLPIGYLEEPPEPLSLPLRLAAR